MGDWETDWGRDALKRIVILLFALANLADLAANVPFLRRRRVLGILNRGETEARAFLIGMACGEAIPAEALETSGDMADLAVRLRALALMLCVMLAQASSVAPHVAVGPRAGPEKSAKPVGSHAAPPAPDTS